MCLTNLALLIAYVVVYTFVTVALTAWVSVWLVSDNDNSSNQD